MAIDKITRRVIMVSCPFGHNKIILPKPMPKAREEEGGKR